MIYIYISCMYIMYVSIGPCPFAPWRREEKPLSRQREGERFLEKLSMNWIS